jgi:hypothetical protein
VSTQPKAMNADEPVAANPYFGPRSPVEIRRIRRFTLAACGCACLLGYAIVVPLKLAGIAPPHFTWMSTVAIVPFAFGGIGVGIVVPAYSPRHPTVALIVGALSWMAIFAAIFAAAEHTGW